MSTIDATFAPAANRRERFKTLLKRAFVKTVEARSRSAERTAAVYLHGLSDGRLRDLGLSAPEIAAFRAGGSPRDVATQL